MADHLLDHVRPYLDRSTEERIAYIQVPRWIGHQVALIAHERLAELLSRPPSLRTRGLMLVGPYANGKTMIAERFAVGPLRTAEQQRVWVVQTREGAGLAHFYGSILQALRAPTGSSRDVGRKAEQVDHLLAVRAERAARKRPVSHVAISIVDHRLPLEGVEAVVGPVCHGGDGSRHRGRRMRLGKGVGPLHLVARVITVLVCGNQASGAAGRSGELLHKFRATGEVVGDAAFGAVGADDAGEASVEVPMIGRSARDGRRV